MLLFYIMLRTRELKNCKIAFVVPEFPSVSQTFVVNQITDMIERGNEVRIFSFKRVEANPIHQVVERFKLMEKTTYFTYPPYSGAKRVWWFSYFAVMNFNTLIREPAFTFRKPASLRNGIRNLLLSRSFAAFYKTHAFDIVHVHFGQRGATIANVIAKGLERKFKFVVSFHGYDLNPHKIERYRIAYKNLFHYADGVTVNSPYLKDILLKVCPHPKNLQLLPEGLRTDQFQKQPLDSSPETSRFTILFCGRFVPFKAPDLAIHIMDVLVNRRRRSNVNLRMVGEGKLRNEVERLINDFNLKEHVYLLGALSQEEVIKELSNADLFLLPGIHEKETGRAETQGLVIQEAQAMELPVVVSDAGGMKYGLIDGVSGFVVKEGDVTGFAEKIELLINDEQLRASMAKAGRDFVVKTFDTKILGDKLSKIYDEI